MQRKGRLHFTYQGTLLCIITYITLSKYNTQCEFMPEFLLFFLPKPNLGKSQERQEWRKAVLKINTTELNMWQKFKKMVSTSVDLFSTSGGFAVAGSLRLRPHVVQGRRLRRMNGRSWEKNLTNWGGGGQAWQYTSCLKEKSCTLYLEVVVSSSASSGWDEQR